MLTFLLAGLLGLLVRAPAPGSAVPRDLDVPEAPAGWTRSVKRGGELVQFRPRELEFGQRFEVEFRARTLLEPGPLERWLAALVAAERPPKGNFEGADRVVRGSRNVAWVTRSFRSIGGDPGHVGYLAVTVDDLHARVVVTTCFPSDLQKRYSEGARDLTARLVELEKAAAKREGRGLALEVRPPEVSGIDAGGPLVPGRYVGQRTSDGKSLGVLDLTLHADGEFEFVRGVSEHDATGFAVYSEATGRLDLAGDLRNSTYDPSEDFCIYGREADGTPVVYAENGGIGTIVWRLRRTGEVRRRPPSEVALLEAAARAEASRYKWVTPPGRGIRPDEIAALVYASDLVVTGMGSSLEEYPYLLMTDGRVLDGLPVPPDQLDVAASRSREPDRWGRWRAEGETYVFAWPVRPDEFRAPRGHQSVARPVPAETRLDGRFGACSSWSVGFAGGGASFWGIDFTRAGRFETWRNGIASMGGSTSGLDAPLVGVGWDDEGSATVISGPNVGGGTRTSSGVTLADRSGTYAFDGYALELRYDNGQVRRLPTFFTGAGEDDLWFEGAVVRREQGADTER